MAARNLVHEEEALEAPTELSLGQRREVVGFAAFTVALLTTLSLWSFEGAPTSAQVAAASEQSLTGVIGVGVAAALTRLLGALAWSVPVECFLLAVRQFADRPSALGEASCKNAAAIVLPVGVVCALVSLGWPGVVVYGEPAGGKIGVVLGGLLLASAGEVGAWVGGVGLVLTAAAARTTWRVRYLVLSTRAPLEDGKASSAQTAKPAGQVAEEAPPRPRVRIVMPPSSHRARPTSLSGTHQGRPFALPSSSLLARSHDSWEFHVQDWDIQDAVDKMLDKLEAHRVFGIMKEVEPGPVVTTYAFRPAQEAKLARVAGLADDLALALGVDRVRVAPAPGRPWVGIEAPTSKRSTVMLRPIIESEAWRAANGPLPLALGLDTIGRPTLVELSEMPHLLVGGATGSGKSVGLNAMLVSLLLRRSPDEVRLIMIDMKTVEFARYADIPHLLLPVITEGERAWAALQGAAAEMERRYQVLAAAGALNLSAYNARCATRLPYIVIVIDEVADLLKCGPKDVTATLLRLGQKARAAGIHLILSTQRPSVDVLPGTLKANLPTRIAFTVARPEDSRTILGAGGAERLLGRGDMLVVSASEAEPKRVHAPYLSEEEVRAICQFLRAQGAPHYDESFLQAGVDPERGSPRSTSRDRLKAIAATQLMLVPPLSLEPPSPDGAPATEEDGCNEDEVDERDVLDDDEDGDDALYWSARAQVMREGSCSVSALQNGLAIGHSKAAKLVARMEADGFVGESGFRRRGAGRPRRAPGDWTVN